MGSTRTVFELSKTEIDLGEAEVTVFTLKFTYRVSCRRIAAFCRVQWEGLEGENCIL